MNEDESEPAPKRRWRPTGTAVVGTILVVAVVGGSIYNNHKKQSHVPPFSSAEQATFGSAIAEDPVLAPLAESDPDAILKDGEAVCTYRDKGHTEIELLAKLEQQGFQESAANSLTETAEIAFCPYYLDH